MIAWLSSTELTRRLRTWSPIGLSLYAWFQARADAMPGGAIPQPGEVHADALGAVHTWSGLVDTVPFAVRSVRLPRGLIGLEVLFPVPRTGDAQLIDALEQVQRSLPRWKSPSFDQLQRVGATFAVVGRSVDEPLYRGRSREEAARIAAFLARAGEQFSVVSVAEAPAGWLVVGPDVGPYVSRVEPASSENAARRLASRWAAETGATFDVRPYL